MTDATSNPDDIIQTCIDEGFDVGIVTASGRSLGDVCAGDKSKEPWMSGKMCERLNRDGGRMFNSMVSVGSKSVSQSDLISEFHADVGMIKGSAMKYGKETFYPDMKDRCVVLFDNDPSVLEGVGRFNMKYGSEFQTQCASSECGGRQLSVDLVRDTLFAMKKNGCY